LEKERLLYVKQKNHWKRNWAKLTGRIRGRVGWNNWKRKGENKHRGMGSMKKKKKGKEKRRVEATAYNRTVYCLSHGNDSCL
jgi:hypothetical protein